MAGNDAIYQEAVGAVRAGDKARARDLLTRLLKMEPANIDYWIWMSAVVETTRERIYCLQEAQKRDPKNAQVRRGLMVLGALPFDESLPPAPLVRRKWQSAISSEENTKALPPWYRIALPVGAGLIVIVLLVLAITFTNKPAQRPHLTLNRTSTVSDSTTTLQATASPVVRSVTPTFVGATPLYVLLKETYTPTPVYLKTPHTLSGDSFRAGVAAYQRQDWAGAINQMEQVLTAEPGAADAIIYIANSYMAEGDYTNAYKKFNEAVKVNPTFAPGYLGRARVLPLLSPQDDRTKDILADINKAIQLDPNYFDAYIQLAVVSINTQDVEAAQGALDQAEKVMPSSPLVPYYRAQAYRLAGEPAKALEQAQQAQSMDITMLPAYRLLAEVYLDLDKVSEAGKTLQTYLLYVLDDPAAYTLSGTLAMAKGDVKAAISAYSKALVLDEQNYAALMGRAEAYLDDQQGKPAYDDLAAAARIKYGSFRVSLGFGRAYMLLENQQSAIDQFDKAYDMTKSDKDRAEVLYYRARAFGEMGSMTKALIDWLALAALPGEGIPVEYLQMAKTQIAQAATPTASTTPTVDSAKTAKTSTRTATMTKTRTATPSKTASLTSTATRTKTTTPTKP